MVKRSQRTLMVKQRKLAFWDDITKESNVPKKKKKGETVTLLDEKFYYGAPWADKPYYKVNHYIYGDGYVLAEAF